MSQTPSSTPDPPQLCQGLETAVEDDLDTLVDEWRVNWVWMPLWRPERSTEDGRDRMRALGFNIGARPRHDDGVRPGMTTAEAQEKRALKRRDRLLEQDNETRRANDDQIPG